MTDCDGELYYLITQCGRSQLSAYEHACNILTLLMAKGVQSRAPPAPAALVTPRQGPPRHSTPSQNTAPALAHMRGPDLLELHLAGVRGGAVVQRLAGDAVRALRLCTRAGP